MGGFFYCAHQSGQDVKIRTKTPDMIRGLVNKGIITT